jgi:ribonuclease HI
MAMLMASDKLAYGKSVQILSDSTYAVNAMTVWGAGWKRADWLNKQKKPRANKDLISRMYELYCDIGQHIEITHVKAHSGIQGNELSDRMCTLAIRDRVVGFEKCEGLSINEVLALSSC